MHQYSTPRFQTARAYFLKGVEFLPAHTPSLMQLCTMAEDEGDWEKAAEYMEESVWFNKHTLYPAEQVNIQLATLYKHLDQPENNGFPSPYSLFL